MADFSDWFKNIPYFTKRWLTLTLVLTLAGRFGILNPAKFLLFFDPFVNKFEVSFKFYFGWPLKRIYKIMEPLFDVFTYYYVNRYGEQSPLYSYTHYHL